MVEVGIDKSDGLGSEVLGGGSWAAIATDQRRRATSCAGQKTVDQRCIKRLVLDLLHE